MIKMPHETDFDVHVAEAAINVIFKPTESHYSYRRLADDEDHARYGRVEREPLVRHGKPRGGNSIAGRSSLWDVWQRRPLSAIPPNPESVRPTLRVRVNQLVETLSIEKVSRLLGHSRLSWRNLKRK